MGWNGLRVRVNPAGIGARTWQLLWEASVLGEPADEGDAIFLDDAEPGFVTLYFPPSAQLLATAVGARPCMKPDIAELALIAGRDTAWHVHFGGGHGASHASQPIRPRREAA